MSRSRRKTSRTSGRRRRNAKAEFPWRPKDEKVQEEGERVTQAQYHQSMRSFAKEILGEAKDQGYEDLDDAREWIDERVHETADGTEWVIYTKKSLDTLMYSDHWLAAEEDGLTEGGELSAILPVYAYAAVRADLHDYIEAYADEYFEEDDDDD